LPAAAGSLHPDAGPDPDRRFLACCSSAPGDTVDALMAQMGAVMPNREELRRFYGLDLSVRDATGHYLWRADPARFSAFGDLR